MKPLGEGDKAITASTTCAHPRLVEIDAADLGFADLRGEPGDCSSMSSAMKH